MEREHWKNPEPLTKRNKYDLFRKCNVFNDGNENKSKLQIYLCSEVSVGIILK